MPTMGPRGPPRRAPQCSAVPTSTPRGARQGPTSAGGGAALGWLRWLHACERGSAPRSPPCSTAQVVAARAVRRSVFVPIGSAPPVAHRQARAVPRYSTVRACRCATRIAGLPARGGACMADRLRVVPQVPPPARGPLQAASAAPYSAPHGTRPVVSITATANTSARLPNPVVSTSTTRGLCGRAQGRRRVEQVQLQGVGGHGRRLRGRRVLSQLDTAKDDPFPAPGLIG